ncbi:MAG: hypothetical protein AB9Q20_13910 [Candidatus Reddybacter sp.]
MDNFNLKDIDDLKREKYVSLEDVIKVISRSESLPIKETMSAILALELERLRPVTFDYFEQRKVLTEADGIEGDYVDAIRYQLGGLSKEEVRGKDDIFDDAHFSWEIPTLVDWCKWRCVGVPLEWQRWMLEEYPYLLQSNLCEEVSNNSEASRPNVSKNEMRKAKTALMHKSWQEECIKLKKNNPGKSNVWISTQISQMPIGEGKSPETIRKIMRK